MSVQNLKRPNALINLVRESVFAKFSTTAQYPNDIPMWQYYDSDLELVQGNWETINPNIFEHAKARMSFLYTGYPKIFKYYLPRFLLTILEFENPDFYYAFEVLIEPRNYENMAFDYYARSKHEQTTYIERENRHLESFVKSLDTSQREVVIAVLELTKHHDLRDWFRPAHHEEVDRIIRFWNVEESI